MAGASTDPDRIAPEPLHNPHSPDPSQARQARRRLRLNQVGLVGTVPFPLQLPQRPEPRQKGQWRAFRAVVGILRGAILLVSIALKQTTGPRWNTSLRHITYVITLIAEIRVRVVPWNVAHLKTSQNV